MFLETLVTDCTRLVALTQVPPLLMFVCFQAFGKKGEEFSVSIVHVWATPQVVLGNLETTAILVCVAQPYITESWELLHQYTRGSCVQQSHVIHCRGP